MVSEKGDFVNRDDLIAEIETDKVKFSVINCLP